MRLYVPEIGDTIRLTSDWTFELQNEYRNRSLWELMGCDSTPEVLAHKNNQTLLRNELNQLESSLYPNGYWRYSGHTVDPVKEARRQELYDLLREQEKVQVTIAKGSVLSIDRIYIRKGGSDWSSLTFFLKESPTYQFKKKPRFWTKLSECNKIEFESVVSQY